VIIAGAEEYIFPLYSAPADGDNVDLGAGAFLGTAFLVSSQGDAITAAHVIPLPEALPEGHRIVAATWHQGKPQPCWITHAATFESFDVALLQLNLRETKWLPLLSTDLPPGSDLSVVGIPNHQTRPDQRQLRHLKGHVTLASDVLELSCAVPRGMSGSPVFMAGAVVGYATGMVRSEEIEDSVEEVIENEPGREKVSRTEIRRVTSYGIARSFAALELFCDPIFGGKNLLHFVNDRNHPR